MMTFESHKRATFAIIEAVAEATRRSDVGSITNGAKPYLTGGTIYV